MNWQCLGKNSNIVVTALSILISVVLFFIYGGDLLFDEFEHLRASYLVSLGFHPYKDFFEHHHPLIWYIWSPFLKHLPHNQILLFYFSRFLTLLLSCGSIYYIYQIGKNFFGGKKVATIVLCIYFSFYFAQTIAVVFKPDAYMWFFFLCGLYHFLCFTKTKSAKHLCICTSAFSISFLFLQTAIFLILPIFLVATYILYKDKSYFIIYFRAIIPAIIILTMFFGFIYRTSGLISYYQRNWILNVHLNNFLDQANPFLPKFLIFIIVGYAAYAYQLKQHLATFYTHFIALFLTVNLIKNMMYLSSFPHYFQAEAFAVALLFAPLVPKLPKIAATYLFAALIAFNGLNILTSVYILPNRPYLHQIKLLNRKDVKIYTPLLGIYTPHYPYYWFFPSLEALDDQMFHHPFDINSYIVEHIDYLSIIPDTDINHSTNPKSMYQERNTSHTLLEKHLINSKILEQYYELIDTAPNNIYRRKSGL